MTVIVSTDAEGGTNGATVTAAAAGVSSVSIGAGGSLTFDSAHAAHGGLGFKVTQGASGAVFLQWSSSALGTLTSHWGEAYFYLTGYPSASNRLVAGADATPAQTWGIDISSTGTIIMRNAANTNVHATTTVVPLNQWVRVEWQVDHGAGTMRVWLYTVADGATAAEDTGAIASAYGASTTQVQVGVKNSTPQVPTFWMDDIAIATAKIGPVAPLPAGPTVNVGPDLTKETGGAAFTVTASETAGAAAIVARNWRIVSGTNVTLSGTSTATLTVTPPSTTGSTVLGYIATDANGNPSAEDTLTVTWVAPGQSYRPVGDVTAGSWTASPASTPMAGNLDEVTPDAADYVVSPNAPTGQEYKLRLEGKPAPGTTTGVFVEVLLWVDAAVTSHSVVVTLYDSDATTVRKTVTYTDLTSTPTVRQIPLSSSEAGAITGWQSGLVLGVKATAS